MSFPLVQRLRRGAQGDDSEVRERLALEGPIDDTHLTVALVGALASDEIVVRSEWTRGAPAASLAVASEDNVASVLSVLRSGSLVERRRAALRLATLLRGDVPQSESQQGETFSREPTSGELSGDDIAKIDEALTVVRDMDVGYELLLARRALPGAAGQEVRDEDALAASQFAKLDVAIRAFWEGDSSEEPLSALAAEEIAILAPRLREASDGFLAHLSALIEGADGTLDVRARKALISAFRHAGDRRLVPSLALTLASKQRELATSAARALGRIEDPRTRTVLLRAYRASVRPTERAVLAGALGLEGEFVGRGWVRALLSHADTATLEAALEAMATLGQPEDAERLAIFLAHENVDVVRRAVRALGRTGDGRALLALTRLRARREGVPVALLPELDEAESAVRARLELRGEEVPEHGALTRSLVARGRDVLDQDGNRLPTSSFWGRSRALLDWVLARIWIAVGIREPALRRLELAALRRPGWAAPLVTLGASYRPVESAHALSALRRALEADRPWVERHAARLIARVFLRRAEETARDGRNDIARGLLEEALSLDLRRAPSSLRFELERRLGALRGDGA